MWPVGKNCIEVHKTAAAEAFGFVIRAVPELQALHQASEAVQMKLPFNITISGRLFQPAGRIR